MAAETVRAAAGHMHLLGKSITIVANAGTSREATLLDIPVWDFDDQSARPLADRRPQVLFSCVFASDEPVAEVVAAWTGIPTGRLLEGESAKLLRMEEELGQRVVGKFLARLVGVRLDLVHGDLAVAGQPVVGGRRHRSRGNRRGHRGFRGGVAAGDEGAEPATET